MINELDQDEFSAHRSVSEQRYSFNGSVKRSNSDERLSAMEIEEEEDAGRMKVDRVSRIPKLRQSKQFSNSSPTVNKPAETSSSLKWNSTIHTARAMVHVPSISRRAVQGVLVRFFRNGDAHHAGVSVAINELELKSWEAFLNYLNHQQKKLSLASGGIKHIYSLTGREIRSISKFQARQSYVVASGAFIKTTFVHINDVLNEEPESVTRWRSPPSNAEQIFLLPYSRMNIYESMFFNRSLVSTFDQWLNEQVTALLARFIGQQRIAHLYAITKFAFTEVKSFSQLFNMLKVTDTFIGCTEEEYEHSQHYLTTVRPSDFFINSLWPRKPMNTVQRYVPKQEDAQLSLTWIYGYDGMTDQTKTLHSLVGENEILYVIGSVCVLYEPLLKQQRYYTKHTSAITCLNTHRYHSLAASSEITSLKDRSRVLIYVWNPSKLDTLAELRREQFGSDIALLSFGPKSDDNLLLVVSREKPKILLILNWKRNELMFSLSCKSDRILSALFIFNTTSWIACLNEQHLLFYQINWNSKPLKVTLQREGDVQNIYTGAMICDTAGDQLVVGDKLGSVHLWRLVNQEPKLILVKEGLVENEIQVIISLTPEMFLFANGQNQIKIWKVKSNLVEEIRIKETFGCIQSVCLLRQGSDSMFLAIGTRLNYILWKDLQHEQIDVIMRGHTSSSVSLCCQKTLSHWFSVSADRYLFKWNSHTKLVEWSIKCPQLISCADLHPERNIIILGTETSKLLIYDTLSSFYIATILLKFNTGVKSVRFSPNGAILAVGLQNGTIGVFDVLGNGDFRARTEATFQSPNAPVTDVIWSTDSNHLLAVYSDNNSNMWSLPSFNLVKGKGLQSIAWQQPVHPITCSMLEKSLIEAHSSAIVLSPNLILGCGKDGQLRLFRNYYEKNYQTLNFTLGPIQSIIPSTDKKTFLLSIADRTALVEVQINME